MGAKDEDTYGCHCSHPLRWSLWPDEEDSSSAHWRQGKRQGWIDMHVQKCGKRVRGLSQDLSRCIKNRGTLAFKNLGLIRFFIIIQEITTLN